MSSRRRIRRGWPGTEPGHALDIAGRICDAYERVSDNPDTREQKSIRQQDEDWQNWMPRAGVLRGRTFTDNDVSASPFAGDGSQRKGFAALRAYIASGRADEHVLWFWTWSRQTRGDIPLDVLARESAGHGIVWAVGGQILNPANGKDMQNAKLHGIMDEGFSWDLSEAVLRGKRDAALKGLPSAIALYGYKREYETGADGQMVLVKGRPVIAGDVPCEPAASIVREIFDRVEALEPFTAIAWDLRRREIPVPRRPRKCTTCGEKLHKDGSDGAPRGWYCSKGHEQDMCRWVPSAVRFIAMNEGYLGRRIFQAESSAPADRRKAVLDGVTAKWPPLVTQQQFSAVQAVIAGQAGLRWRNGSPGNHVPHAERSHSYLMTPAARCGRCGSPMGGTPQGGKLWYKCRGRSCTTIRADWLDAWAEDRLVSWMTLLDVQKGVYSGPDDEEAAQARAVLEREHANRKELLELAREGRAGPPDLIAAQEEGISRRIAEAEAVLQDQPSPLLGEMFGYDVADRWAALRRDQPDAARALLAEVATVYVNPAGSRGGGASRGFDENRIEWHWNIGPETSAPQTRADPSEQVAARKQALDEARQRAEKLLTADPAVPDNIIGEQAGCAYGTVKRIRGQLLAAGTITEPGYRTGRDGAVYRISGNGKGESRRVATIEGRSPRKDAIVTLVTAHPGTTAADVAEAEGITVKCAQTTLGQLTKAGRIRRAQRGVYVPLADLDPDCVPAGVVRGYGLCQSQPALSRLPS